MQQVFEHIYRNKVWKNKESISGPGSNLANTEVVLRWLPRLIRDLEVRVLLDIPCGDFHWMKEMDLELDVYIGADIIEELMRTNLEKYCTPEHTNRQFMTLDITSHSLPDADLIFCRDCLVHFSDVDVGRAINNIRRSGARYLLTTTFTNRLSNTDIITGQWRPLNLQAAPFRLPLPERLISEEYTGSNGNYSDKQLALWKIGDLVML